MARFLTISVLLLTFLQGRAQVLSESKTGFDLAEAIIYVDPEDYTVVKKSAELLSQDIERVTGRKIAVVHTPVKGKRIVVGSVEKSALVRDLVRSGQLPATGAWEEYRVKALGNTLVIAGHDRRGTAFGVFEVSRQIGVSPWYWWADVPVKERKHLYLNPALDISDAPKVKYRGIFINDEAPALTAGAVKNSAGLTVNSMPMFLS